MTATATGIVITAGAMTFANEWYQTNTPDWKIPVATVLAGAIFEGLANIDPKAAVGLSAIIFIGALTTRFNGKSVADTIGELNKTPKVKKPTRKVQIA